MVWKENKDRMNENLQEANTNRGAELGELIRKDRVAAGLSQSELARRSGIDKSTIYRLEQGEFTHLDPQRLQRIASALGTEVEDYFALSGYYTTHGLPNLGTYLRSKYDASPDVADDVEKYFRFLQQQSDAEAPPENKDEQ
jgi:transcriptional regulator with XRE-family HTH domain